MFSGSIEFSDEDGSGDGDSTEEDLENLEAVNVRIIKNKNNLRGFVTSELDEDIFCYKIDSLVTKSLLDMTKLDGGMNGCDTNQDIPEQTQLSATILGSIRQLNPIIVIDRNFFFSEK